MCAEIMILSIVAAREERLGRPASHAAGIGKGPTGQKIEAQKKEGITATLKAAPKFFKDLARSIRAGRGGISAGGGSSAVGAAKPAAAAGGMGGAPRELHTVDHPGRIQSRINIREGDGTKASPGLANAWRKHGDTAKPNKSQFTIRREELKTVLQDKVVIQAPIKVDPHSGSYVREVDIGRTVGRLSDKGGSEATSKLTILTDQYGNLVNVYPGPFIYKGK
jgi:hypothetical protein